MNDTGDENESRSAAPVALRGATPADYPAIAALLPTRDELFLVHPSGKHPFTADQVLALARVRRDLTVAEQDGSVVAFANLYDVVPGRRAFVGNLVVSAACRGAGLGRRLAEHMIRLGFDKYGVAEMAISVFSHNVPALLLYRTLGFRPCAVEERQTPEGGRCALLHMQRLRTGDAAQPQDPWNRRIS